MTRIPAGWGFADAPPRPAPPKDTRRSHRAAGHLPGGGQRVMHMRFALWAAALGRTPKPGETADHLRISYETARRLVADWQQLTSTEEPA